jgi:hypothetical protein
MKTMLRLSVIQLVTISIYTVKSLLMNTSSFLLNSLEYHRLISVRNQLFLNEYNRIVTGERSPVLYPIVQDKIQRETGQKNIKVS